MRVSLRQNSRTGQNISDTQSESTLLTSRWIFPLIILGVALPAVWSRRPGRRKDARQVLEQLLTPIRPRA
ncbi:hypothetical protein GCM10009555_021790 [Acrocarpospora macrocephala]|uniref:Uncharacterized protein n=1 Tax=Acrocarpospora macrocephala TaxID=150177 RepID=A0A5M3WKS6_9ACTN|nr:hypothetical protein Amac_014160 [Acrocarpospora macrocephala]